MRRHKEKVADGCFLVCVLLLFDFNVQLYTPQDGRQKPAGEKKKKRETEREREREREKERKTSHPLVGRR
jgi:hypothetical protein